MWRLLRLNAARQMLPSTEHQNTAWCAACWGEAHLLLILAKTDTLLHTGGSSWLQCHRQTPLQRRVISQYASTDADSKIEAIHRRQSSKHVDMKNKQRTGKQAKWYWL
jgi:hypothetical protein